MVCKALSLIALVLLLGSGTYAATHTINFGGSLGFAYSPSSLTVNIGDTVVWNGDFGMHPLSSTSVPSGAATFHNGAGTQFSYAVEVAGTYHYQCDVHASIGMVGQFTAQASPVILGMVPSDGRRGLVGVSRKDGVITLRFAGLTGAASWRLIDIQGNQIAAGVTSPRNPVVRIGPSSPNSSILVWRSVDGSELTAEKLPDF